MVTGISEPSGESSVVKVLEIFLPEIFQKFPDVFK